MMYEVMYEAIASEVHKERQKEVGVEVASMTSVTQLDGRIIGPLRGIFEGLGEPNLAGTAPRTAFQLRWHP